MPNSFRLDIHQQHQQRERQAELADALRDCIVEDLPASDSLELVLINYFENHMDRPDTDNEDPETGWSEWAKMKTHSALSRLASFAEKEFITLSTRKP